ncbi:PucR family transcriptional regulator [Streptomyces sp. NPDC058989]|uniref:PucR family transcriptional regulator n=1 Tax=Streptomyces sp. NPDC058989 TaxID=3346686 RepID=UPI00368B400D
MAELARVAGWPLPCTVMLVAVGPAPSGSPLWVPDGSALLAGPDGQRTCLVVPEPDHRTGAMLARLLRGRTAAMGPAVPWEESGVSLRWARRLLDLNPPAAGTGTRLARVEDHLLTLLLLQDEHLNRLFIRRRLHPLTGLQPGRRERAAETLLAWLETGSLPQAAKRLKVHPETVRYRMRQIESLFGSDLYDADARFALVTALRSVGLTADSLRRAGARRAGRRTVAGGLPSREREARINGL